MTKNIMTWNTGLTEGSDPKKALAYIKGFLDEKDNTIAVLEMMWKVGANLLNILFIPNL